MEWKDQYKHPSWQKKRLEALEAARFECQNCGDNESQLHVHHKRYIKGRKVWEYQVGELSVLCESCHELEHIEKEVLGDVLAMIGPGRTLDAAALIAGYFDASYSLDGDVPRPVTEVSRMFYELGVVASVLEGEGRPAWIAVLSKYAERRSPPGPVILNVLADSQPTPEKGSDK